ncbi:MAG: hypothetical protein JW804_04395 [Sedimentisphaerales bacterium]|nr:hypothetical protein [Sedimentisphaerales bacterium]
MKSKMTLLILAVSILLIGSAYPKENEKPIYNTQSARCMVKITADQDFLALSPDTVRALLNSTDVRDKAIRETFNMSPREFKGVFNADTFVQSSTRSTSSQSIQFWLDVALPEDVKPVAEEFMDALINNMRTVLLESYKKYKVNLQIEIENSRLLHNQLLEDFKTTMNLQKNPVARPATDQYEDPQNAQVEEQMKKTVDMSALNPDMPFEEAINIIKHSVDPPLEIFVNWRDLSDNASIDKGTPIGIDPVSNIELGLALKLLFEGVSGGFADLDYAVEKGIVVIATGDALPLQHDTRIYEVSPNVEPAELAGIIQQTVEDNSWYDVGGTGTISIHANKLIINQTGSIHKKINVFLQNLTIDTLPVSPAPDLTELTANQQNLQKEQQGLERNVAVLKAQRIAVEEQIAGINHEVEKKMNEDAVTKELQQLITELEQARNESKDDKKLEVIEKITEAKVRLAERRQTAIKEARGDELERLNGILTDLAFKLAESKASLETVTKQLTQVKSQLRSTAAFDPDILKIKEARQALEAAANKLNNLNNLYTNSSSPTVMVFGSR